MSKNSQIKIKIEKIGRFLIQDENYRHCPDLVYNPSKGIIPKGPIFEYEGRDLDGMGSIIVGLNPGPSGKGKGERNKFEKLFNQKGELSYKDYLNYWEKYISNKHDYFKKLRNLADELELRGPILWTNLVKCESKKRGVLSVQTIRGDIYKYLFKEISIIPSGTLLIGAGEEAYKILSYRFPNRLVIGVPHPSSWGRNWLNNTNNEKIRELKRIIKEGTPVAIHTKDIG